MRRQGLFRLHHEEEGVTAVIIALCLISLFGMLVLVVDVGGLLWKRREMVSGADAAALAAAKTCSVPVANDPTDPEVQADTAAVANVGGLNGADGAIVDNPWACTVSTRTPRGYITVQYSYPQKLFFAGIFGASSRTVTTAATAAWGPLAGGNAVPIVLESSQFQGSCDVPDLAIGAGVQLLVQQRQRRHRGRELGLPQPRPVGRRDDATIATAAAEPLRAAPTS